MKFKITKRSVLGMILTFGLTFGIVMILSAAYLITGVFNTRIVKKDLKESDYYSKVAESTLTGVEEILKDSSLTLLAVEDTITVEKIYIYCNDYAEKKLDNQIPQFNENEFKQNVKNNIYAYFTQNNIALNDNIEQTIEILASSLTQECKGKINIDFINQYIKFKDGFQKISYILLFAGCIFSIFMILCLLKLYHHKYKALRCIISAMLGSLLIAVGHYIYITKQSWVLENLDCLPDYYMNFIYKFCNDCKQSILILLGCMVIIVFLNVILTKYLQKNER